MVTKTSWLTVAVLGKHRYRSHCMPCIAAPLTLQLVSRDTHGATQLFAVFVNLIS